MRICGEENDPGYKNFLKYQDNKIDVWMNGRLMGDDIDLVDDEIGLVRFAAHDANGEMFTSEDGREIMRYELRGSVTILVDGELPARSGEVGHEA